MQSVVIRGKKQLSVEERAKPVPTEGMVLVAPKFVGICGSDLHYYEDGAVGAFVIQEPLVPGHEVSGVLAEAACIDGADLPGGTPVAIHPSTWGKAVPGLEEKREIWPGGRYLGSAASHPHTQGAMTELLEVRPDQLRVLPKTLPIRRAALAEPLGVAIHALAQAGAIRGKRLLVFGAGPIGLLVVAAGVILGASEITAADLLPGPLERAKGVGATKTIQIGEGALPASNAFDVVLECTGTASGISHSFRTVSPGSVIVQVGIPNNVDSRINLSGICAKEVTYRGTFRFDKEFNDAIQLLDENPVLENIVTHTFPVKDVAHAFKVAHDPQVSGKVLLEF